MNKIKYLLLALVALVTVSCNKQEVFENTGTLVINISSKAITKAALSVDPSAVEDNINTLTVGVFASDGTVKTIRDFTNIGKSVSMRVLNLSGTDKVVCVINTASGTFANAKTIQDFNNKEIELGSTVSQRRSKPFSR